MIRQPIISVLGHVDHGKCVTADTEIVLADGSIHPIKEIYDSFSAKTRPSTTKDGEIIDVSKAGLRLLSIDEYGSIKPKRASHLWKRRAERVIEVSTKHGSKVKVTPEHPFFSLDSEGNVTKVRADELEAGDFILVPSKVPSPRITLRKYKQLLLLKLAESPDFLAFVHPALTEELRDLLRHTPNSKLIANHPYDCLRHNRFRVADLITLSKGRIPLEKVYDSIESVKFSTTKQRASHAALLMQLPKTRDQFIDAFYVLGALWGDGTRNVAHLSNTDGDLIAEYKEAVANAFGLKTKIIKQRTTNTIVTSGGKTFSEFVCQAFDYPRRSKSCTVDIPELIQRAPNEFLAGFISGYFDTDGYVSASTGVEVLSMSENMIKKLSILLQRFGCPTVLSRKGAAYRLKISGSEYLRNFKKGIGFRLQRKEAQADALIKKATTNRNFDILPVSGMRIRNLRVEFGLSGMETGIPFQKKYEKYEHVSRSFVKSFVSSMQRIVSGGPYQATTKDKIKVIKALGKPMSYTTLYKKLSMPHRKLANYITFLTSENIIKKTKKDFYTTTGVGKKALSELLKISNNPDIVFNHTGNLSGIVSSDFVCVQLKSLKETKKEQYVYDFTVPDTHNFVADRCIIHNTSFLDKVRESSVAAREAGGITQHIGATEVPIDVVKKICGKMLEVMKVKVTIPGLLFVDTPGHEAFTNLRKRGGSIADLAVLVIDIREGFMPQTIEALEILKAYKTPFIIVANKVDLLSGWHDAQTYCFREAYKQQQDFVKKELEKKIYELIGKLSEMGIQSERFDRVDDFTKQVSIIPMSAKTGEGVAEALMILTGLSQRYLEKNLQIGVSGPGRASILEVKEEKGLGTGLDLILYDGTIKRGDTVILSGKDGPIETKVKALLKPKPLDEMRDPKDRFDNIASVAAASGLKLVGPGIEDALAGGQVYVVDGNAEELREKITRELESVRFEHENVGVIVRADTLGSLEAILGMLQKMKIPVRKADIGAVTKTDLMEAESIKKEDPEYGVVMAFNAPVPEDVARYSKDTRITLISDKVIYKIIEDFEEWVKEAKRRQEMAMFDTIPFPAELKFLEGCTFRRSGPAIIGMAVIKGRIRPGYPLMKEDGTKVGAIESLQEKNEKLEEAQKGDEIAVAIDGPLVGRNIEEGDILYTYITFGQYEQILKKGKKFLNGEETELLKKIADIVRRAKQS